ncbi:MAG: hypothetical protein ACOC6F_03280 [bacterium]
MHKGHSEVTGVSLDCRTLRRVRALFPLESVVERAKSLYREVIYVADAMGSGRLLAFYRNRQFSGRSLNQVVKSYAVEFPDFSDSLDLIRWLESNGVRYHRGKFCVYVPPEEAQKVFGPVMSSYPPDAGLKILRDLKPPGIAKYCSKEVYPRAPITVDRFSYRPSDYLKVANYLYSHGLGPRIYDLVEVKNGHTALAAYITQHVSGATPSWDRCMDFIRRVERLCGGQLMPLLSNWRQANDFRCPDCHDNLILDEITGGTLYVDFQAFMIKDPRQHALGAAKKAFTAASPRADERDYLLRAVLDRTGAHTPDQNAQWALLKPVLQRQGISLENVVLVDVRCGAGALVHAALVDGAFWTVGWERPSVAAAARELLWALGMSRFDILDADACRDGDIPSVLRDNVGLSSQLVLLYRKEVDGAELPERIKNLPFQLVIYQDEEGLNLSEFRRRAEAFAGAWHLQLVEAGWMLTNSDKDRPIAVLAPA